MEKIDKHLREVSVLENRQTPSRPKLKQTAVLTKTMICQSSRVEQNLMQTPIRVNVITISLYIVLFQANTIDGVLEIKNEHVWNVGLERIVCDMIFCRSYLFRPLFPLIT